MDADVVVDLGAGVAVDVAGGVADVRDDIDPEEVVDSADEVADDEVVDQDDREEDASPPEDHAPSVMTVDAAMAIALHAALMFGSLPRHGPGRQSRIRRTRTHRESLRSALPQTIHDKPVSLGSGTCGPGDARLASEATRNPCRRTRCSALNAAAGPAKPRGSAGRAALRSPHSMLPSNVTGRPTRPRSRQWRPRLSSARQSRVQHRRRPSRLRPHKPQLSRPLRRSGKLAPICSRYLRSRAYPDMSPSARTVRIGPGRISRRRTSSRTIRSARRISSLRHTSNRPTSSPRNISLVRRRTRCRYRRRR